jgi:hypothetical protein
MSADPGVIFYFCAFVVAGNSTGDAHKRLRDGGPVVVKPRRGTEAEGREPRDDGNLVIRVGGNPLSDPGTGSTTTSGSRGGTRSPAQWRLGVGLLSFRCGSEAPLRAPELGVHCV